MTEQDFGALVIILAFGGFAAALWFFTEAWWPTGGPK